MRGFADSGDSRLVDSVQRRGIVDEIPIFISIAGGIQPAHAVNAKHARPVETGRLVRIQLAMKRRHVVDIRLRVDPRLRPMPKYVGKHSVIKTDVVVKKTLLLLRTSQEGGKQSAPPLCRLRGVAPFLTLF